MHALWPAARDLCLGEDESVIFVTHPPFRWDELLDTRLPLLLSHRIGSWEELAAGLHEAGCPATVPLRLVESNGRVLLASWKGAKLEPRPETQEWTLALGWTHVDEGWRARLPLWGRRFIVTRAAEQGGALAERLRGLGAEAYTVPTIAFCDPDDLTPWIQAVTSIESFDWILLTSPNGVDFFIHRLCESGLDLRVLSKARFACIGPSTAKSLNRHGLKADLIPEEFVAEGLLAALRSQAGDLKGQRILLPRAQVARTVLPDTLSEAGAQVLVAPVYKTVPPALPTLPSDHADILFTSSSTVTNWVQATRHLAVSNRCYCIGPITAETARGHGLDVAGVATVYTVDGLVELLINSTL